MKSKKKGDQKLIDPSLINAMEKDYQELRIQYFSLTKKLERQMEWDKHLTSEISRLLKYEKDTKAAKNPKIWDVWRFFLKWLFPPPKNEGKYMRIWPEPPTPKTKNHER